MSRWPDDVARIQRIAADHGVVLSDAEAESAWDAHSETMAAGWIGLPDEDEHVWADVSPHIAPEAARFPAFDNPNHVPRWPNDVARIQAVAATLGGRNLSAQTAESAWDDYSDTMAAGWLGLPEDDADLWACVQHHLD